MKDRLREIRKSIKPKLSQEKFGELLGITRTAYAKYEAGIVVPSDTFIQLLCSKFNVSEEWLRTGAGSMHRSDIDAQVDTYARGYSLDAEEREIIRYFLQLDPPERAAMIGHVEKLAAAVRAARTQEPAADAADAPADAADVPADAAERSQRPPMTDAEIEADVAAYRAALIAEQKEPSVSSSTAAAKRA